MEVTETTSAERGAALITVLVLMALLTALLATHFSLTWVEMSTTRATMDSFRGLYAAEAGLNVRADVVRGEFAGFDRPSGTSPDTAIQPCVGTNLGSGDYACASYSFQDRDVATYLVEPATSGKVIVIPRGETFQNMHGREYHHVVYSRAMRDGGGLEAALEMHVKSRLVNLFQFAVFFDKDLELIPRGSRTITGPVHANGDLFLGTDTNLDVVGQVTAGGEMFRGRKDADSCLAGPVRVNDPDDPVEVPTCSADRREIVAADVGGWNGMIDPVATLLTVPDASIIEPVAGQPYWDRAEMRIVLDLTSGSPVIEARQADGTTIAGSAGVLAGCGATDSSTTLYNQREGEAILSLDVDVQEMMNCIASVASIGFTLDDASDGGMVWHFSVDGPDSSGVNNYGVRLHNAGELRSSDGGAPIPLGLTIATDQALYVEGDFNAANKIPAALLADSFNVLSNNWSDANSTSPLSSRTAADTIVQAAVLAGSETTGGADGPAGRDAGGYTGGLDAMIRLHEDWSGDTLTFRGSLVSLDEPVHVDGAWVDGGSHYAAPVTDWDFDIDFEDPTLVPPLSPRFVYVKQELFVRQFEI